MNKPQNCPRCQAPLDLTKVEPGSRFTCASCKGEFMLVTDSEGQLAPTNERGCLTCMIPVIVLWLSFVGGMIWLWPRIQVGIETGFASVVEMEARAEHAYRERLLVDSDGDGVGEFIGIADMPAPRPGENGKDLEEFPIAAELKEKALAGRGVIPLGAYSLVIYLPDAAGGWVMDDASAAARDPAQADARERAFILYAVPNRPGWLGSRVFVADQGAPGGASQVWSTPNTDEDPPYSKNHLPAAAAAYPSAQAALDAPLGGTGATEHVGSDGRRWTRWVQ